MAIQQINLGSMPLGAGGDTQRVANEKTNENFSNTAHAASRLVGTESSNVLDVSAWANVNKAFNTKAFRNYLGNSTGVATKSNPGFTYTLDEDFKKLNAGDTVVLSCYLRADNITTKQAGDRAFVEMSITTTNGNVLLFIGENNLSTKGKIERYIETTVTLPGKPTGLQWGYSSLDCYRGPETDLEISQVKLEVSTQGRTTWTPSFVDLYSTNNTIKDSKTNLLLKSGDTIPSNSAASRLVGTSNGQIPLAQDTLKSSLSYIPEAIPSTKTLTGVFNTGEVFSVTSAVEGYPFNSNQPALAQSFRLIGTEGTVRAQTLIGGSGDLAIRSGWSGGAGNWQVYYHTGNTTKDTATGFLKASSPVLHVYNDSITKIHEAEQLDITVDKKGVGHYEIHGTTGLRKNDGWFMSPPRDVHGNVLSMVDLEEKDGVVILRTYKKKFDFETVSIVHDWDNPMDIPDGVCVELRFNDLPEEQLDEPIE